MNNDLNFNNAKRIFAFGCSFTNYKWPTWADLIALDKEDLPYYNFGKAGFGNTGIACRIAEANKRFVFNENDLILVMWSTFLREDRWLNGNWFTQGNVYNSGYPKNFLDEFTDPIGYLIRDQAIISMVNDWIKKSFPCNLILKSVPLDYTEVDLFNEGKYLHEIKFLYGREYNDLPVDLFSFMDKRWDNFKISFIEDLSTPEREWVDFHPSSLTYFNYLKHIGYDFKSSTYDTAVYIDSVLREIKSHSELRNRLKSIEDKIHKNLIKMF